MQNEKIVDRVRKLLALAASDNVNEAATAAALAQKLMAEHRIEIAMLHADNGSDDDAILTQELHRFSGAQTQNWVGVLGSGIAEVNGCACYYTGHQPRLLCIVGSADDAANVRQLFVHLVREIERLAGVEAARAGAPGRTWKNNFRLGAVSEIKKRLFAAERAEQDRARATARAQDTAQGTSTAIVRVETALSRVNNVTRLREAMDHLHLKARKVTQVRSDAYAFRRGQEVGATVALGTNAALGQGARC